MNHTPAQWTSASAAAHLSAPGPNSDKYRRGVLNARTGSSAYPGAAVLGVEAAWRTGLGMLRYVSPLDDVTPQLGLPSPAAAVLAARPETVFSAGSVTDAAHTDAWLLGSGTDPRTRSFAERAALHRLFTGRVPLVVDAGALPELADALATATERSMTLPPTAITPHQGEFLAMWRALELGDLPHGWAVGTSRQDPAPSDAARVEAAAALAERVGATVLLKGSTSAIATPGGWCALVGPATPWLATAGTGDVLGGILGTLAATHSAELRDDPTFFGPLAASAALLHDRAARLASGDPDRPITALDVAHAIPAAIAALLP